MSIQQFLVVIEKAGRGYSAYSPDLPGCIATGKTRKEVERSMHEAIAFHIEGMIEDGLPIPQSYASAAFVLQQIPSRRKATPRSRTLHRSRGARKHLQ